MNALTPFKQPYAGQDESEEDRLIREVADLVALELPVEVIRAQLGLSRRQRVYDLTVLARKAGLLPRRASQIVRKAADTGYKLMKYHLKDSGKSLGSMSTLLQPLTPEVIRWLERQTPLGGSIAETAASMITDAFYEERTTMEAFTKLEGASITLRTNGVYKEGDLYHHELGVFVRVGSGFVKLLAQGQTTAKNMRWSGLRQPDRGTITASHGSVVFEPAVETSRAA